MAPEEVYSIISIDLKFTGEILEGDGERIELPGQPMYVTWYAADLQADHISILDGLLQVPADPRLQREKFTNKQPADLGDRYMWRDPPPKWGPLMFAFVLPDGFSLRETSIPPTQAKLHKGRVAVFWLLRQGEQIALTWQVAPHDAAALKEETKRLNREALDHLLRTRPASGFQYDVALSFAGEDREYVEQVAARLRDGGIRVFYDRFEEANLWGKNLYDHLSSVYREKARYTVMFISRHYVSKVWTTHERQSAQARALEENSEYILPARFDDTPVPGLLTTTGYLPLHNRTPADLVAVILDKLRS